MNAFLEYILDAGSNASHVNIVRTSQLYEESLVFPIFQMHKTFLPSTWLINTRALDLGSLVLKEGHTWRNVS